MRRSQLFALVTLGALLIGGYLVVSDWTSGPGDGGVDDWRDDNDIVDEAAPGGGLFQGQSQGAAAGGAGSVGLAVGGAKDVNNFRRNVEEDYLPLPSDVSYEGLFYDYYFDTGPQADCDRLFCPSYAPAVTWDPLSNETDRFVTVGLNSGLSRDTFERRRLNMVVVLDVSGSMDSGFSEYYYDRFGNRHRIENRSGRAKIDVATESLAAMTRRLDGDDRLGVVLYNDDARVAKPIRRVGDADMDAIRSHIRDVRAGGGTDLSAGLRDAWDMLEEHEGADPSAVENRVVVFTDAMPNLGQTSDEGLLGEIERRADDGVHATFVGVGVDFNTELVDAITSIRGANYYSVHSADRFRERLTGGFRYMVTPLVYDLELTLDAEGYEIAQVYGSTAGDEATGEVMRVNTLFASHRREDRTRGGVVLVQLERTGEDRELALEASWEDRTGERSSTRKTVTFPDGGPPVYGHSGARKAVLLARYADLLKNWIRHDAPDRHRGVAVPDVAPDDGIAPPPERSRLGEWERQSVDLRASDVYRRRFERFADHLEAEKAVLGDDELQQEIDLLERLSNVSA